MTKNNTHPIKQASSDIPFPPPDQVFIEPPIFVTKLPEQLAGRVPWDKVRAEIETLGGVLIANIHFNNHSCSFTFPNQSVGPSLRKARAVRRRLMKKLQLDELPYWSISTYTLSKYQDFVKNISQNQTRPDYFDIMRSYVRYNDEKGFMKLYRRRTRHLSLQTP